MPAQANRCFGEIHSNHFGAFLGVLAQHVAISTADVQDPFTGMLLEFVEMAGKGHAFILFAKAVVILEILL